MLDAAVLLKDEEGQPWSAPLSRPRNAVNRRQADKNAQAYANATNAAYAQQAPPPQEYERPGPEEDVIT